MKQLYLILIYFFTCHFSYAQFEKANWHFGPTSKGLFFNPTTNVVSITNNSYTPYGTEGCSVLSNPANGNLMFYTDGSKVIDSTHQLMPNGIGLNSQSSSAKTGKIVPDPLNCNRYYIFHNTSAFEINIPGKLYYSVIDMTLPGNGTVISPLGDIVSGLKNILVTTGIAEGIEIIPASYSHDFWILVTINSPSSISVYKFTSTGIIFQNNYPLISSLSDVRSIIYCKANNKMAVGSAYDFDSTLLMDFNPLTGVVLNQTTIPGLPAGTNGNYHGIYDFEWSLDGTKLYISKYRQGGTGGKLFQYDLTTSITQLVYNVSSTSPSYSARGLRMGPDGKIYFLYTNTTGNLLNIGAVNTPNNPALSCGFNPAQINMGSNIGNAHQFPHFLYQNNTIKNINDTSVNITKNCAVTSDTSLISLTINPVDTDEDNISYQITSVASGTAVSFINSNTIEYVNSTFDTINDTIQIKYCDNYCFNRCDSFYVFININYMEINTLNLPSLIQTCDSINQLLDAGAGFSSYYWSTGDTTQTILVLSGGLYYLTADMNGCQYSDTTNVIVSSPSATTSVNSPICENDFINLTSSGGTTYSWSGPNSFSSSLQNPTIPSATIVMSGIYVVTATTLGCSNNDTVIITVNITPTANAGTDVNLCQNSNTLLSASGGTNYLWNTGETTSSIIISPNVTTSYFVTVSASGCSDNDTAIVNIILNPTSNLPDDYTGCPTNIYAGNAVNYLWSTSDTTSSIAINTSGKYHVTLTNEHGCNITDTINTFISENSNYTSLLPNVFTPNNDGINDEYTIEGEFNYCTLFMSIEIYNRWGQKIFESNDENFKWNGKIKNLAVSEGVYFAIIKVQENSEIKNLPFFISLLR